MRCLYLLAVAMLLGIAPLGGLTTSAQDAGNEAWHYVHINPMPEEGAKQPLRAFLGAAGDQDTKGGLVDRLNAYEVTFGQNHAHVPEVGNSEFMIVIVQSEGFVLDVYEETLVVDPQSPRAIDVMKREEYPTPAGGHEVFYSGSGMVLHDASGDACQSMCTVLPGTPVSLMAGDRIIAPPGHKCYYCLLNGDEGSLFVYPLLRTDDNGAPREFSWLESLNTATGAATPSALVPAQDDLAETPAQSGMIGWAFFNPAPNCRTGPH